MASRRGKSGCGDLLITFVGVVSVTTAFLVLTGMKFQGQDSVRALMTRVKNGNDDPVDATLNSPAKSPTAIFEYPSYPAGDLKVDRAKVLRAERPCAGGKCAERCEALVGSFGAASRVPKHSDGKTQFGWHHYPTCSGSGPAAKGETVVMTMVDDKYAAKLPGFAHAVTHAGFRCVVGAITTSGDACAVAQRVGCLCVVANFVKGPSEEFPELWSNGIERLMFVRQVLVQGYNVVMLDADAFPKPSNGDVGASSLKKLVDAARLSGSTLAAKDNGAKREEAFTNLHWGVSWFQAGVPLIDFLGCLDHFWDSPGFEPAKPSQDTYFRMYHVKISHLIERMLTKSTPFNVCAFPWAVTNDGVRHLTDFAQLTKRTCAMAEGFLRNGSEDVLAYDVPNDAPPMMQQQAFQAAIMMAQQQGKKVALPAATHHGKAVSFCLLFNPFQLPAAAITARVETPCETSKHVACLKFEELTGDVVQKSITKRLDLRMCDPAEDAGSHACTDKSKKLPASEDSRPPSPPPPPARPPPPPPPPRPPPRRPPPLAMGKQIGKAGMGKGKGKMGNGKIGKGKMGKGKR